MAGRVRILIAITLLGLASSGCGGEPPRYAVAGTVTINGAPAPYVVLRFYPTGSNLLAAGTGRTDETGNFKIGQEGKDTGFPAGQYKVMFSQTLVKGKPTLAGSGGKKAEKDATEKQGVADEYTDAKTTPVSATVGSGTNRFTFDIKAKK